MKRILGLTLILILLISQSVFSQEGTPNKCLECHAKVVGKKIIHGPVNTSCDKCHVSNGEKHPQEDVEGFKLVKEVPQLCYSCHEANNTGAHVHPPVKGGDCASCHEFHSSKNEHLVSLPLPDLCFFCHSKLETAMGNSPVVHSPAKDGKACINCHNPHSSPQEKMLLTDQKTLCLNCHNKPITVDNRVIPNMKEKIETGASVHGAIDKNGCVACHNPHVSQNKFLLVDTVALGNYATGKKENYDLCFKCHNPFMIEKSVTTTYTNFRNGDKNLHFVHVNKDKGRTCFDCHDPHASPNKHLIADRVKFGEWDMPIKYKSTDTGGSCSPGCHQERSYNRQ